MRAAFSVTRNDWSLHRKGLIDQERHKEKIKEAVKENLADIVNEDSIILTDGKKIVKVPMKTLEEYKFRFDTGKGKQTGQGAGKSKVGDSANQPPGPDGGQPGQAGDQPGFDYYEAELTLDELSDLVFQDLSLPNLVEKRNQELESEADRFSDIRKTGIWANLDKKRTIKENIKRNAFKGEAHFKDIKQDDLRFKTWDREIRHQSNAVVIAMMDVSGSMGDFEKYIARSFYYWMLRFLRTKYSNVRIVFISHHTEAKEVSEDEFFHKGESGGTQVSSAYQLALDIIRQRYNPDEWNIYPFHFSDGDNLLWDNALCVKLVEKLIQQCNIFGYGEIKQHRSFSSSTLMSAYGKIDNPKFVGVTISDKKEVYDALRTFFSPKEKQHES
jgi:uncharacterized protein